VESTVFDVEKLASDFRENGIALARGVFSQAEIQELRDWWAIVRERLDQGSLTRHSIQST
jgi:hypothetical protein